MLPYIKGAFVSEADILLDIDLCVAYPWQCLCLLYRSFVVKKKKKIVLGEKSVCNVMLRPVSHEIDVH